jgi:hypothetical protein
LRQSNSSKEEDASGGAGIPSASKYMSTGSTGTWRTDLVVVILVSRVT